jgi:chemosensory pili system protein ChpA (sensor histidine kinase/response regulator)
MSPPSPPPSTLSPQAGRLEAFADDWHDIATALAARPIQTTKLEILRGGLTDLAEEAGAGDHGGWCRAVRRIALLTEIWECLESEPEQGEAAADVAGFCCEAMRRLAREWRVGAPGGDGGVAEDILRQSDERWGDSLSPIDPEGAGPTLADEPDPFEDPGIAPDEPPALEAGALLSLLKGYGGVASPPSSLEVPPEPQPPLAGSVKSAECQGLTPVGCIHPTTAEPSPWDSSPVREGTALGLVIPPLPARIELDDELKEAFLADATELFERIEAIVLGLSGQGDSSGAIQELGRCLHTLKGAAGSVGLGELAALVHELEERLGQANGVVSQDVNDLLLRFVDYFDEVIALLRRGPEPPEETIQRPAEAPASVREGGAEGPIRVPASRFDELTDLASELIMQGRFWLSQSGSMKAFAETAQACRHRLLGSLYRLHDSGLGREGRHRPAPVDPRADLPAQLRRLAEQANDLAVLAESARAAAASMVDRGDGLVRVSLQLWDSFQSLRIVPIRGLFQRLARVLHEAARVEGRQVEVAMIGEETGVDRAVQDGAFEPLLHVVRNAVSHGIEPPDERVRLGKPATGRVTLEARREGNTLVIAVGDDGKGLDEQAIVAKARKLGWLGPGETPGRDRIRALIFAPGFSTRSTANAISGRGVGMDVVAREIGQLRGTVDLDSEIGRGTRLTVRLPARLALEPALIVRVGGQPFAVPASQVEQAQPFEAPVPSGDESRDPARTEPPPHPTESPIVTYRDQAIPLVFGREILGIGRPGPASWPKLVLVRTGSRLVGLVVDAIDGAEDLVIKPMGELLAGHPLVSGTSLSIDGEVILVLNVSGLERWMKIRKATGTGPTATGPERSPDEKPPGERMAVLVVDDSISVRRGVARQLHSLGLDVHEVSDGLEALGRLRDARYGFVVTDLEMPKLDGLALLAEMKRSPALATIPVIVASTRDDPETRRRVLELGAQALLSKPVDPPELARIVEPFLSGVGG